MNYSIEADDTLKIIRYKHSGKVDKEEIGKAWQGLIKLRKFTELNYNLLSDYRAATFNLNLEDVELISDFLSSLKHVLNGKKQSLIIDNPKATAFSIMFEDKVLKKIGFKVNVFSTIEAAEDWLVK